MIDISRVRSLSVTRKVLVGTSGGVWQMEDFEQEVYRWDAGTETFTPLIVPPGYVPGLFACQVNGMNASPIVFDRVLRKLGLLTTRQTIEEQT